MHEVIKCSCLCGRDQIRPGDDEIGDWVVMRLWVQSVKCDRRREDILGHGRARADEAMQTLTIASGHDWPGCVECWTWVIQACLDCMCLCALNRGYRLDDLFWRVSALHVGYA